MEANMFQALHMEQNEVLMCRFLADLLDPKGWHGRTDFLESFLKGFGVLISCCNIQIFSFRLRLRSTPETRRASAMTTLFIPGAPSWST